MNADAARGRHRERLGRRQTKLSDHEAPEANRELRWELRGRLHAALQELDVNPVDWDVVQTVLEGAVESIQAAAA